MIAALLLPAAAAALLSAQPPETAGRPIVVTGERPADLEARLAACLARHCPVNEDVDATLALAEVLFVEGRYTDARAQVTASLRRNSGQARAFPEPVSDLYRVHARLSRTLGDDVSAVRSTRNILDALEAGLPTPDYRHFTAMFEIAELQLRMGYLESAKNRLSTLADLAHRAGREDVAAQARTRMLWYEWLANPRSTARRRLEALAASADPARRMDVTYARFMLARILRQEGHAAEAEAMLMGMGRASGGPRVLLNAPPYQLRQREIRAPDDASPTEAAGMSNVLNRTTENYQQKWIDVGFWVSPEGHVSDVEVLRRGAEESWARPLLDSIQGRLYSAAGEPTYRVERYTMTAGYETVTGSHIPQHSPRARVEYLDLTSAPDTPPPTPPAGN